MKEGPYCIRVTFKVSVMFMCLLISLRESSSVFTNATHACKLASVKGQQAFVDSRQASITLLYIQSDVQSVAQWFCVETYCVFLDFVHTAYTDYKETEVMALNARDQVTVFFI